MPRIVSVTLLSESQGQAPRASILSGLRDQLMAVHLELCAWSWEIHCIALLPDELHDVIAQAAAAFAAECLYDASRNAAARLSGRIDRRRTRASHCYRRAAQLFESPSDRGRRQRRLSMWQMQWQQNGNGSWYASAHRRIGGKYRISVRAFADGVVFDVHRLKRTGLNSWEPSYVGSGTTLERAKSLAQDNHDSRSTAHRRSA